MFKQYYLTKIRPHLKRAVDEIRHPESNPQTTAFSMSLGMFVGILVPIGFQSVAFIILFALVRYNFIIACAVSMITNPFTVIPLYFIAIKIGEFIINVNFPWKYFDDFMEDPLWEYLFQIGLEGSMILFAGLLLLTLIFTPLTYFLSFKVTSYLKLRKSSH
jgi:hypothetical protein